MPASNSVMTRAISGPATAHYVIEGRAMHLQLFILLLGFWSNPIIAKGFCVLAMVNNPPELGVSLARSSFRARAPGASERSFSDR